MEIKVAFYKGKGDFLNGVVRWWTKSIYSHAELVLPDGITWIGISPFLKSKVASRKKLIIDFAEWDFINLEVTSEQLNIIMEFFEDTEGQRYDWLGMLLSQFLPCKIRKLASVESTTNRYCPSNSDAKSIKYYINKR